MTSTDKKPRVVGIGGTLREGSTSLQALEETLRAAEEAGASTELLDLRDLALPMHEPGKALEEYDGNVGKLVGAMRGADALVLSTGAYHGTLAGVTKNALDFAQFLARGERPYLQDKVVGLVATAGGEMAAINAVGAMIEVVHALRGVAAPLPVPVTRVWKIFDREEIRDEGVAEWLASLGRLVVALADKLSPDVNGAPALRATA